MAGVSTVTLQLYFLPLTLAVIVALPLPAAVTLPLEVTVATFLLEVDQVTFLLVPVIFRVTFCPLIKVTFVLLSFTVEAACTVTGEDCTGSTEGATSARTSARLSIAASFLTCLITSSFLLEAVMLLRINRYAFLSA